MTQADIIDFARAVPLELVYDNGLVVTCQIVGAGTVIWLRADISLRAGADAAARAEASALKARFAGWACFSGFGKWRSDALQGDNAKCRHK